MKTFQVDDRLIWISPNADEPMLVIYRGVYQGKAFVYRIKSGWQGVVDFSELHLESDWIAAGCDISKVI